MWVIPFAPTRFLGAHVQPIDASSIRGSMVVAPDQPNRGLTAIAGEEPSSTGELDIFVGATEVLITNEGGTAIDLIAVAGCPAIELSTEVISAPVWDAESQRFVAEHEVTFLNRLANPRASALRSQQPEAATPSSMTSSWTSQSLQMDSVAQRSWNRRCLGNSTAAVATHSTVSTTRGSSALRFGSTAAIPNVFDSRSPTSRTSMTRVWAEGVGVPAPTISLRGRVDSVQVGVSARLRPDGAELDTSTAPSRLVTPAPGLTVEHSFVTAPESTADGAVTVAERIVVANIGDTAVNELVVRYPLAEMYGPGTVLTEFSGSTSQACVGLFSPRFNGGTRSVAVYDETGLGVGEQCVIDLQSVLLPGIVPTSEGADYEAPVVATARSGRREVRDATAVQASLAQNAQVALTLGPAEVTNLEDGRYRFVGSLTARNTGDQNISDLAARIDFATQPNDPSDPATPTRVQFEAIEGDAVCAGARLPRRSASAGSSRLAPRWLWAKSARLATPSLFVREPNSRDGPLLLQPKRASPRRLDVSINSTIDEPVLEEAPEIESVVRQDDIRNNADGTYRVTLTTTITNSGDTPLVAIGTTDDGIEHFADAVLTSERIGDDCSSVSFRRPLTAPSQVDGKNSCSVTQVYLVDRVRS